MFVLFEFIATLVSGDLLFIAIQWIVDGNLSIL